MEPRFEHDCTSCLWLGQLGENDVYACLQGIDHLTIIRRYGDDGPEYSSGRHYLAELPQEMQDRALSLSNS